MLREKAIYCHTETQIHPSVETKTKNHMTYSNYSALQKIFQLLHQHFNFKKDVKLGLSFVFFF